VHHYRADLALESFLETYWSQSKDYLRAEYPGSSPTGYWTFAQGLDALLDGVERTEGQRFLGLVDTLIQAQARRGWIASHYDDESWMTLALLRAYELTGRGDYLELEYLPIFQRGDSNVDGVVDISDAITILGHLFLGDPVELACQKSADTDDEGTLELTDAVYLLRYLFSDGAPIPAP
jgi:hypothetical protein